VDPQLIRETVDELAALVVEALAPYDEDRGGPAVVGDIVDVTGYAEEKHAERTEQIVDAASEIPHVDDLVRIETDD
jgi:ribonucleoside-diphosphate reductase beta chain